MKFNTRPSWRSQWEDISAAVLLLFLSLLTANDYFGLVGSAVLREPKVGLWVVVFFSSMFVLVLLAIFYHRYTQRFTVTNEAIEVQSGLIEKETRSLPLKALKTINVKQSITQRILGIADLEFEGRATNVSAITFFGITKPFEIERMVGC